jgi:hypothetical protein
VSTTSVVDADAWRIRRILEKATARYNHELLPDEERL